MATFYPLKFTPILKERIWGGQKLKQLLHKKTESETIGESWEISAIPEAISVVANGTLKGESLQTLINRYPTEVLGGCNHKRFGKEFPLLIKFIDAKHDLSIQLHPNDDLAKKRHNSFGKTEMWYVIHAEPNAKLIVGFNQPTTKPIYQSHLEKNTLPELLNFETVKEGDCYFIEAGRIHAIGAGIVLAEIQQTSDVTYRVYDWDRVDANGNARALHTEQALGAIDFHMKNDFKVSYIAEKNRSNGMVDCPYFKTNILELDEGITKQNDKESFIIYICVEGNVTIQTDDFSEEITKGETVLLPAAIAHYELISTHTKLLEVYV